MIDPAHVAALMRPGERLDDLQRGQMAILQRPGGFCFGQDSVLLAAFASRRPHKGLLADLGTGSGVLALLCAARMPGITVDAIEIQPDMADMAQRSVLLNGMEARIHVHTMDLRGAPAALGHGRYAMVVCNPPYGPADSRMRSPEPSRDAARHEGTADIAAIAAAAGALLQNGGRFAVVYPAQRMLELADAMRGARIEPKHVRMIHPQWGRPPNLLLMEGVRLGRPMLHFLPPLYVRDAQGVETDEIHALYDE